MTFSPSIISAPPGAAGGGGPVIPTNFLPWIGLGGVAYPDWPTLEGADPGFILGPVPADPGSGISVFISAGFIGAPITTEDWIVNVSPVATVSPGDVREWAKVTSFNPLTGEIHTSKPLDWSGQDALVAHATKGNLVFSTTENVAPTGPADINLGGNTLNGKVTFGGGVDFGKVSFGKINNGLSLAAGAAFVFEEVEVFPEDLSSSVEGDNLDVGHVTAINCVFHGWVTRFQDASFDIFNCKNLGLGSSVDIAPWTFLSRDGANPPSVTDFRVNFVGGEFSGTIFDLINTPTDFDTTAPYISIMIDAPITPWKYNSGPSNRRSSIFRLREGTIVTYTPDSAGDIKVKSEEFGEVIPTTNLDMVPGFAFLVLQGDFTGAFTANIGFDFYTFDVPGCQSSIVKTEGPGTMSGAVLFNTGNFILDVGEGGVGFLVDIDTEFSGTIDLSSSHYVRGDGLIPTVDALVGYVVVRTPGGVAGGGTVTINGLTEFGGGAIYAVAGLGAGPITGFNLNVAGVTLLENMGMNIALLLIDAAFSGVGAQVLFNGFIEADLANYDPTLSAHWIISNQGSGGVTVTGGIDVTNFSTGSEGGFITADNGSDTRMSGALTVKDAHITGAVFDWVRALLGLGETVELSGSVVLSHFRASGGGIMTVLNIAAGATGIGPAVWRLDDGIHLMQFPLTGGGGLFAWANSVRRDRFMYYDFPPDLDGTYIDFYEAYKCHLASAQSLAPLSTAYLLSLGIDPAVGFFFFDCKLYADIPAGSQPQILDDWVSIVAGPAIPFGQTVGINAGGLAVVNAPFPGQKLVGVLAAGGGVGGSALICTKGRVKVDCGVNVIVPGLPLIQSVIAGVCHNGPVGGAPDNTVGVGLTPNVAGFSYAIVGCAN